MFSTIFEDLLCFGFFRFLIFFYINLKEGMLQVKNFSCTVHETGEIFSFCWVIVSASPFERRINIGVILATTAKLASHLSFKASF